MEIIADEGIRGLIQQLVGDSTAEAVVVQLEKADEGGGCRSRVSGLDDVLARAVSGIPIIMLGWQTPTMYGRDSRWRTAMGYPNVVFRRLPATKVALAEANAKK